jgi:spermidine synthase
MNALQHKAGKLTMRMRVLLLCVAVAIAQIVTALPLRADGETELIYKRNSLYHEIFVYRNGSVVTLNFTRSRNIIQSKVDTANLRQHMLEYSTIAFCGLMYQPEPRRVLVVGLGGGVIPREMHHYFPAAKVDVVEIDPEIPVVAQTFFGFKTDDLLKVCVEDGRVFIRRLARRTDTPKYDYIMLDAFNADYIPFHLMTKEFLEEVKAIMANDGVVVANVFSKNELFHAEFKTYVEVFGRCQVFLGEKSTNAMIVSTGESADALTPEVAYARAEDLQKKNQCAFDLRWVARRLQPNLKPRPDAMVLTDDRAPVNVLRFKETEQ